MANEPTRIAELTEIVNAEYINPLILDYAIDKVVIAPLCSSVNLAGKASRVASFAQWEKDTAALDITEGTALEYEDLTTADTVVTVAQVGIAREVTDFAMETNILGREGIEQRIVLDGAQLCTEMLEDDLAALFADATGATVGTSGADLTVANFVEAIARMDTAKARGRKVCVLDDQQALDLRAAVAASTGSVFAGQSNLQTVLNARSDAFVGTLFDVPIWMTNLTDTANAGADVVGAMFIDGQESPTYCAFGIAYLWMPRLKSLPVVTNTSTEYCVTMAYGVGSVGDAFAVKLVTDA